MILSFVSKTDPGLVRQHNEDSIGYFSLEGDGAPNFFIVADGMGGHQHGDVASRMVIETLTEAFSPGTDNESAVDRLLTEALQTANSRIFDWAKENGKTKGVGSTATCLSIKNGEATIAQVGDSGAYLLRNGELVKLTRDHSYVTELGLPPDKARVHPMRNVITRAVGFAEALEIDVFRYPLLDGDLLLVASDGLTGEVPEGEIKNILLQHSSSLETASEELLERVKQYGAEDNVSFFLVKAKAEVPGEKAASRKTRTLIAASIIGALIILALCLFVFLYKTDVLEKLPFKDIQHKITNPAKGGIER